MTLPPNWSLQKSIYTTLTADSTLIGLVSGIFDSVPDNKIFPYVVFDDAKVSDWSTNTTRGWEINTTIHVLSREKGKKQCSTIMDRIYVLLHDVNLSVTDFHLVLLRMASLIIELENDGITYRGILRFRALLHN